ncbi:MAG: hypothetical protein R2880_16720 [Deinococcales bacterium]
MKDGVKLQVDHIKPKDKGGRQRLKMGGRFARATTSKRKTTDKLKQARKCSLGYMNYQSQ